MKYKGQDNTEIRVIEAPSAWALQQEIAALVAEGYDIVDLKYGTASGKDNSTYSVLAAVRKDKKTQERMKQ